MKNLKLVKINTTAYSEEDFFLITDLTNEQIVEVIEPIVLSERNETRTKEIEYDNEELFEALERTYKDNHVQMFVNADKITI